MEQATVCPNMRLENPIKQIKKTKMKIKIKKSKKNKKKRSIVYTLNKTQISNVDLA